MSLELASDALSACFTLFGMSDEVPEVPASDQLRKEIHGLIRRYGQESDVTVYQALGVLEIVKLDLVEMLERSRET